MATDPTPNPNPSQPPPLNQWFNRLGLSGKLMAGGGLGGLISAFLPAVSVSVSNAIAGLSGSAMVIQSWPGRIGLICSAAALVLSWLLYQGKAINKNMLWAAVGVGGVSGLCAIWLLFDVMRSTGGVNMMGSGVSVSPSIGAFTNLAAGLATAAGGFLKAREEKLL